MNGSGKGGEGRERGVVYWRARAEALEADLARLRRRLRALARALPPELVPLLERDVEDMPRWVPSGDALIGLESSARLVAAEVEDELERLWEALPPRPDEE